MLIIHMGWDFMKQTATGVGDICKVDICAGELTQLATAISSDRAPAGYRLRTPRPRRGQCQ